EQPCAATAPFIDDEFDGGRSFEHVDVWMSHGARRERVGYRAAGRVSRMCDSRSAVRRFTSEIKRPRSGHIKSDAEPYELFDALRRLRRDDGGCGLVAQSRSCGERVREMRSG